MTQYIKKLITMMFGLMIVSTISFAQHISVSAPSQVLAGENFRLVYTVNTQNVEDFRAGNVPSGLEVIAGPYTSQQSSYQMVNGHTSSSSSITFTYTLYAVKNGTYTISAAHANVNGKRVNSASVKVRVMGSAPKNHNGPRMNQQGYGDEDTQRSGAVISGNDLFVKVTANKKCVYEQEPILLTYKLYRQVVDITSISGNMPDLKGFHTQQIKLPQQKPQIEKLNGKNYICQTISQYLIFPQMTGKQKIPSFSFEGTILQKHNVDPLEAFFNGGSSYSEIHKNIVAPGIDIQVLPLPTKPSNFSGGVGRFNISSSIDKKSVKAGDPISIRLVIGGNGNMKLLKQPQIKVPKGWSKYDPKITDKTRLTTNGVEGNVLYDFVVVPDKEGSYTLPPLEFVYFDTNAKSYKTLKTQSFKVNVTKGDGKGVSSEDFSDPRDQDIHPIMKGKASLRKASDFFFGSTGYVLLLMLLLVTFIALLIIFRKRAIANADIVGKKANRAHKVAAKKLRTAHELMLAGKHGEFYDEVLRALWGYVGDKLNMPVESLNRENIQDNLKAHQVDDATILKFVSALDECEYERYAPGDIAGNMNKTFESAMTGIMEIEDAITQSKKAKKNAAKVMLMLLFLMVGASASAVTVSKQKADREYLQGEYQQAINDYELVLRNGESAEVYYNLGNAYYKNDDLTKAILNYERAHLLDPGNEDINFNLEFARAKTIDKIVPVEDFFLVEWYNAMVNFTSVDGWAVIAVLSLVLAIAFTLAYLFGSRLILRKVGFYGGIATILLFFVANIFASQQKEDLEHRTGAIVISSSATIMKTPSMNGTQDFVLHEGTRVDIMDKTIHNWREIKVGDGRTGWILTKQLEEI